MFDIFSLISASGFTYQFCFVCCYGLNYIPPWNSYVEFLIPSTSEYDCFEKRVFKQVIKFKGGHWLGSNPIWLGFYKKRRLGYREAQRETQVKPQGDGHLQAKERPQKKIIFIALSVSATLNFPQAFLVTSAFNRIILFLISFLTWSTRFSFADVHMWLDPL